MRTPDLYTESVFEFLDKCKPGQSFIIENLVKQQNHQRFIEAVKLYIRSNDFGGGVEFNSDYTKIKIFEIPWDAIRKYRENHPE